MTTYNHLLSLAFEVHGSKCPQGSDITRTQIAAAVLSRVADLLSSDEIFEATLPVIDTFEEK